MYHNKLNCLLLNSPNQIKHKRRYFCSEPINPQYLFISNPGTSKEISNSQNTGLLFINRSTARDKIRRSSSQSKIFQRTESLSAFKPRLIIPKNKLHLIGQTQHTRSMDRKSDCYPTKNLYVRGKLEYTQVSATNTL